VKWLCIPAAVILCCVSAAAGATPEIQHWTTSNGAQVYFVEADEIPIVDIRFVFNAGSALDGGVPGLSQIVSELLTEGAGELDANEFSERIADTGAEFESGALRDMAWVSLRSLSDRRYLDPSLELMREVLTAPRFDDDAIARIKANTLVGLKHEDQSPAAIASKAFYRTLYGKHPYGSPVNGTEDSVAAISRDDIARFHQRYYVAKNATIAIVGALSRAEAEAIAAHLEDGMRTGERAAPTPPVDSLERAASEFIEFPSIQSHIYIGQPGMKRGDPDYFPLLVGNHVLGGGGLVSILFDEVREKRGLSYSVSSNFLPMAELGPFAASLQTDNSQQDEAIAILRKELEDYIANGPTEAALEAAKRNLIGGFPLRIDSNSKIVEYLSMIGFYGLPLDYLNTFAQRVEAVSVEDVKAAFQRRLDPTKMVTVVVGRATPAAGG